MRARWCVDRWYAYAKDARRVRDWLITEQGVTQADLVQNKDGMWAILYATTTQPPEGCRWHQFVGEDDGGFSDKFVEQPEWYANWRAEFVAERGLNV